MVKRVFKDKTTEKVHLEFESRLKSNTLFIPAIFVDSNLADVSTWFVTRTFNMEQRRMRCLMTNLKLILGISSQTMIPDLFNLTTVRIKNQMMKKTVMHRTASWAKHLTYIKQSTKKRLKH